MRDAGVFVNLLDEAAEHRPRDQEAADEPERPVELDQLEQLDVDALSLREGLGHRYDRDPVDVQALPGVISRCRV